jgi:hypothetical protein
MVAPLIGAGIRAAGAAARGLAKKFGKKTEEPRERFKSSYDKAKEAEDKIKAAAEKREKIKEGVKTPVSKGAISAGVKKLKDAPFLKRFGSRTDRGKLDKKATQAAREAGAEERREARGMKHGGMVKSSASKRADGCAKRGKTKCKMV